MQKVANVSTAYVQHTDQQALASVIKRDRIARRNRIISKR